MACTERGGSLSAGRVRQRQVAARRERVGVPLHQPPRIGTVGHEVQHRGHQQPDRLAEVDERPQVRVIQHLAGVPHVGDDQLGVHVVVEQAAGHGPHHRVVVHVHHARVRGYLPDGLVRVALGRQARSRCR